MDHEQGNQHINRGPRRTYAVGRRLCTNGRRFERQRFGRQHGQPGESGERCNWWLRHTGRYSFGQRYGQQAAELRSAEWHEQQFDIRHERSEEQQHAGDPERSVAGCWPITAAKNDNQPRIKRKANMLQSHGAQAKLRPPPQFRGWQALVDTAGDAGLPHHRASLLPIRANSHLAIEQFTTRRVHDHRDSRVTDSALDRDCEEFLHDGIDLPDHRQVVLGL
jgi:hypothetical protein